MRNGLGLLLPEHLHLALHLFFKELRGADLCGFASSI